MSLPRSVLVPLLLTAAVLAGCTDDGDDAAPTLGQSAEAAPEDPAATAATLAMAFDEALRQLDGRYAFELEVTGARPVRVEGLHLGDRTTTIRTDSDATVETIVVEGNGIARRDDGVWVPVDPPADHDPLAPLLAVTEVAVTGWDVEVAYPADLLGLAGDRVGAAVATGEDGSLTLSATGDGVEAELVFRPVGDGIAITAP